MLKYGNLDSQTALGKGVTSASAAVNSGLANTKGMCYGSTSGTDPVKLFGLENAYGNVWQWLCGLYSDGSRNLLTTTDNFGTATAASNWEYKVSSGTSGSLGGYMSKAQGTNNGGFVGKATSGSSSTYYCDYAYLAAGNFPTVGGCWSSGDAAGVFYFYVSNSASNSYSNVGSRLMFL